MLRVDGISKRYGELAALADISFEIGRGVFGLLGPNGAGKSSLMRTLATLQRPDSGQITLDGLDMLAHPHRARRRIGYLPQDVGVYPRVTAHEMLDYLAGLRGIAARERRAQIGALLDRVNLSEVADRRLDGYSGGMRRRFGIAAAFLGAPDLVIVDEPTAGLDPAERRRFQLLLAEAARDCVLILSSHIVEDLAGLCTDMALMDRGRIIARGAPTALVADLDGQVWQTAAGFDALPQMQDSLNLLSWRPHQGGLVVRVLADAAPAPGFAPATPDLEDLYAARLTEARP